MKYGLMNRNQNYPVNGDFEALFNDMFNWGFGGCNLPAVDVEENDKDYVVSAELPGYKEDDVQVSVEKHVLHLSSQKAEKHEEKDGQKYLIKERGCQSFERAFSLPEDVDEANIQGSFKDGILTITLPKKPMAQPKKIQIKIGNDK
ncbi:MAG: Hsp20/alpha crystallin family protein [Sphaerochaetaceae bacterium]